MANRVNRGPHRVTETMAVETFMGEPFEVWYGAQREDGRVRAFVGMSHALLIPSAFLRPDDQLAATVARRVFDRMSECVPPHMVEEFAGSRGAGEAWLTRQLPGIAAGLPAWASDVLRSEAA